MGDTKQKPHVLVVDDDEDVRQSLADALEEVGYSVKGARDGIEALEAIRIRRPDLVITDLMMPSMSGWELLGALHDDPELASIPTLILTAVRQPRTDVNTPMLAKPVDLQRLLGAIEGYVGAGSPTPSSSKMN